MVGEPGTVPEGSLAGTTAAQQPRHSTPGQAAADSCAPCSPASQPTAALLQQGTPAVVQVEQPDGSTALVVLAPAQPEQGASSSRASAPLGRGPSAAAPRQPETADTYRVRRRSLHVFQS